MTPLGLLCPGEVGEIREIRISRHHDTCLCHSSGNDCGDSSCCSGDVHKGKESVRLEDMGMRVGKSVEMLSNGRGPVLLRIDESRIAIARGIAMKILVRRV